MRQVVVKHYRHVLTVLGLAAVALAVAAYVLAQQGVRFPLLQDGPVKMEAIVQSAQAVTPGQGQAVQVAGVDVGKIANVKLRDGRAVLELEIERRYADAGLIRTDARAMLRPRTPLKDMYLQVFPGSRKAPVARAGFRIPLARTLTSVDVDEILAELPQRTRDYLALLARGAGEGLKGNGTELAEVFRRYKPTMRDLARVNISVAAERRELRRLVTSLARLNGKLAERPEDLSELVSSSEATFRAIASEDDRLRQAVAGLPGTLRQATQTLNDVGPFADELGPTSRALLPAFRALDKANDRVQPLGRQATPIVRKDIRPFVREARPLVRDLAPAAGDLAQALPEARRAGAVLNRFFNMLAFNPGGRQGADVKGREEGYLFWLAWVGHQGVNLINVDDANGPMRPIFLTGTCTTLKGLVQDQPALEFAAGLSPILATLCGNPQTASLDVAKARRRDPLAPARKGDR
ncbi:MAG: MCE family protein [Solirubrobacterales bacterium]|nr:MCE family protein [Solirubrobacterales bacterium]